MIRLGLVDDHLLVREGLRRLLEASNDVRVVAEAASVEGAVRAVLEHRPDVLLLDVWLPPRSGLDVMEALKVLGCLPPTLLLSSFEDLDVLTRAKRLGALGYLIKDVSVEVLLAAVRSVASGRPVTRPLIGEDVHARARTLERERASGQLSLTPRERDVLGLIASGQSTRDVARSLGLQEGTVKNHLSNVIMKLGVRDRTQAVLRALQFGLL